MPIQIKPPCNGLTKFDRWLSKFFPGIGNYATFWRVASEFLSQSTLECPLEWEDWSYSSRAKTPLGEIQVHRELTSWEFRGQYYETREAAKSAAQDFVNAELNGGGV